ncbi:MAG: bifunctional lysylphosphatidylglycerol flippase/synthetase MprF [Gemmatimonadaceae bacterium]|nr:bifunctional lysylphosphatidylglycerol flippase/synthetase MprF [Gemmatimonadaceae bacterium]
MGQLRLAITAISGPLREATEMRVDVGTATERARSDAPGVAADVERRRWIGWVAPIAMLALVALALHVLRGELAGEGYHRVAAAWLATPRDALVAALAFTAIAYVLMTGYDLLALRHVRAPIGTARAMLTSMLAYSFSQALGFPLLTGGAIRVRYWSAWGLSDAQIAGATAFVSATFTVGVVAVCGLALVLEPTAMLSMLHLPAVPARALGVASLLAVAAYTGWAAIARTRTVGWRRWSFEVPDGRLAIAQVALAIADWCVAGLVAYVLLPPEHGIAPIAFLGVFVLAQVVGVASHVPGGVGVFETVMLLALKGTTPSATLLASLLAYRTVYYLVPFATGLLTLAVLETRAVRRRLPALMGAAGQSAASAWSVTSRVAVALQPLLPSAIAISAFIGGALLLFSGATPAVRGRVGALTAVLPLGLVELGHFVGSLAGVGLVVLAAALRRRLDAAWAATVGLLAIGIVASLLKGLDWEEAVVLGTVLVAVLLSRNAFYRPTAVTADVLTPGWMAAVVGVVGASVWLGLLAYRRVDYRDELWWQFATHGNAPRFLRASAGAIVAVFTLGLWRLLRPAALAPAAPTEDDLGLAEEIVRRVPESTPALAMLGDKSLLFASTRDAFVMYGVSGRSWIAMGDPVGPTARLADVAWRFQEEADACGAIPVFYQVTPARLPLYVDLGLTLLKLGEEATVPLTDFSLEGNARKWMRRALKEAERHHLTFEVVPREGVAALMPELRQISDEWLDGKRTREKGFSLGRFDERYLLHFPVALVREGGRLVAFANLWTGALGGELSPDLMRRAADAPKGTMDFLFVELLRWGQQQGYRVANLGMTPLAGLLGSGLSRPQLASLWARAGSFVYRRGEALYNFQGLRAFKEKFDPVWEPRYLACPGGIALPRVLADVATLIAGGVTGIVRK